MFGFRIYLLSTYILAVTIGARDKIVNRSMKFPTDFKLGVSTSAYQIEGAWNVGDKGMNVWDEYSHGEPSPIEDRSNGDVSTDFYNKYKEDLAILKDLGVDSYRLSLSWSRILPTGFADKISQDGIRYYKNLLDDLNVLGIEPLVTIYHWDHPAVLGHMGGWTNEMMVTWFVDYARVVFEELGDRIKMFATINEPMEHCKQAYSKPQSAPGKSIPGIAPYLCVHNMLKAHAKAYRIYDTEYRKTQNGIIGIVIACSYFYPKYANDTESAEVDFDFRCGWAADPIFSSKGDYPDVMKQRIAENSKLEGYPRSRLPEFTKAEIDEIRGTADYFALNHYTSYLSEPAPKSNNTLWWMDTGIIDTYDPSWPRTASSWLRVVPRGFGDLLKKIKNRYGNPPVWILENGMSDDGSSLNDGQRIEYLHDYLEELLSAVNLHDCNIKGYFVWSFLDSFEWTKGYRERFGLVSVDFQLPEKPRTPKLSYQWFRTLIRTRELPAISVSSDSLL